jgi:hypothetical protein
MRELRDHFRLNKWVRDKAIIAIYFPRIDYALSEFAEDGVNPPDETVIDLINVGLRLDSSFVTHVKKKRDTEADMEKLRQVAARCLYEDHIKSVEKGTWLAT